MPLVEMILTLQPYIPGPPVAPRQLYADSCSSDAITVASWEKVWAQYCIDNHKMVGGFSHTINEVIAKEAYKPVIVAGSGPSLKKNFLELKDRTIIGDDGKEVRLNGRRDIRIVSCLHNFNFFEDNDIMGPDDHYITLDSGDIVIKEVYEGGKHDPDWYWARTKDRTLIAFISTHPELIKRWQGKILWFTSPPQNKMIHDAMTSCGVDLKTWPMYNVGGTVAGAALYHARAILGCGPVIFIGMDFCFDYMHKFHSWESQYDKQFSGVIPWTDIWGNRVYTWRSYLNFKKWFDFQACGGEGSQPQLFINCTEGGILGSYPDGNIQQIIQADLRSTLLLFNLHTRLPKAMEQNKWIF